MGWGLGDGDGGMEGWRDGWNGLGRVTAAGPCSLVSLAKLSEFPSILIEKRLSKAK